MAAQSFRAARPSLQAAERKDHSHLLKITSRTETPSSEGPPKNFYAHAFKACLALLWLLATANAAPALTILSGPTFTPAPKSPLAGTLQLSSDVPCRLSITVADGYTNWQRDFFDFQTNFAQPLYGFRPGRTNQITVSVVDEHRNWLTSGQFVSFVTSPVPTNFPLLTLLRSDPARMEPGYTLVRNETHASTNGYAMILNNNAEVIWYANIPTLSDHRMLADGNLFFPWTTNGVATTNFMEMDLLGNVVKTWPVPTNLAINTHDGVPTDHGTFLYMSDTNLFVSNYPTSVTLSNAPKTNSWITCQRVVEVSTNGAVLNLWAPINKLDPLRISYLVAKVGTNWDAEHGNAVIEDPRDNTVVISMRHQNAVIKFHRDTGQIKWILGPHDNWGPQWQQYLLTPVGTPFAWNYAQHAITITPQGTWMFFDNGNFRAMPFATSVPDATNYSRAAEYQIDETNMTVAQLWDYGRTNEVDRLYVDHEGNAEPQPITGNVLIDFAAVKYVNGAAPSVYGPSAYEVRLTEVTHDPTPQVVWDVQMAQFANTNSAFKDCTAYRAHRIPDLYAHPAKPVVDLCLNFDTGQPTLQFSADPFRTYVVQTSIDLINWQTLGAPVADESVAGNYSYQDNADDDGQPHFYRILTQ